MKHNYIFTLKIFRRLSSTFYSYKPKTGCVGVNKIKKHIFISHKYFVYFTYFYSVEG